ncbi:hypothetical protein [Dysgonomonas alginatilytica]|nr:hypothetical protein [Dysgonomonas alginatilytica]
MKRILLSILGFSSIGLLQAQIGVNTDTPKSSLDVQATTTDGSTADGISAPRLTLSQLVSKDARYLAAQTGALVYVTDATSAASAKTRNVTAPGYYYFDGTLWQTVGSDQGLRYFYMPAIALSTNTSDPSYNTSTQIFTIDLYTKYAGQFGIPTSETSAKSPSATSLPVLMSNEIEYLITYYDDIVYKDITISNTGVLTYKVPASPATTDKTFMNILFKIKR